MKRRGAAGFTLIEMIVVLGIISVILAVAMPRLMPLIAFGTHEGAARHLAGYGQAASARAALTKERMTIKIDLDHQEYWSERWPEPEPKEDEAASGQRLEPKKPPMSQMELLKAARAAMEGDRDADQESLDREAEAMRERFDRMQRRGVTTLAKRVKHDREDLFKKDEPLFSGFNLDPEADKEPGPEEIAEPLLERTRLPRETAIDTVVVGDAVFTRGLVEIELTAMGLDQPVGFFIVNEDGEYYTVEWDPMTGLSAVRPGRELSW